MADIPLFSVIMSGGVRTHSTEANFVGGKNYIRDTSIRYITRVECWIDDIAGFPTEAFLELCADGDKVAAAAEAPLWYFPVYPMDLAETDPSKRLPRNVLSLFQPLSMGQLDLQFRSGKPYPDGTIFKPGGGTGRFRILVEKFPLSLTQ